jgi:hypothetical protein
VARGRHAKGVLTGLGILAIPGLGPVVAAGWLASAKDFERPSPI